MANKISSNIYENNETDCHEGTFQFAVCPFVQTTLAKGNHLAKAHHGMGQPCRVAQEQVEEPAEEQGQYDEYGLHGLHGFYEFLYSCYEGVVLCKCLSGNAEVAGGESAEVGGVANEQMVLAGQVVLQLCSSVFRLKLTKHEVGLRLLREDAVNLLQHVAQPTGFVQVGRTAQLVIA